MGIRIIEGNGDGDSQGAVLYCSSRMWAFGPVFEDRDEAEAFLAWYGKGPDLRLLNNVELDDYVSRFLVWKRTQKRWRIVNTASGFDYGVYDGANEDEALAALTEDDSWDPDVDIGAYDDLRVTEERP